MGDSDIVKYLQDFDSQIKNMKMEVFKTMWYMRGGISHQEALNLSPEDRKIIYALVKENMDTTKKSGLPFF
jgi:hypothetical protein|tara:strand:- start:36 stop:248 length:213 start_codon:yes stop_codon:yes gene_type:complete